MKHIWYVFCSFCHPSSMKKVNRSFYTPPGCIIQSILITEPGLSQVFQGPENQKTKQGLGLAEKGFLRIFVLHPKNDQAMICVILVCRLLSHKVEICIMFRKPNLYSTTNSNRRWPIDQKSRSWTMEHIITNGKLTVYHSGKSLESYIRLNHTGNPSDFARFNGLKVSTKKHNLQLLHAEDRRGGASKLKPSFHEIKSVVTRVATRHTTFG